MIISIFITTVVMLITSFALVRLVEHLLKFRSEPKIRNLINPEERWKKAREKRIGWEIDNPFTPASHPERQELLQVELGAFMLFLAQDVHLSKTALHYRALDLEALANEIEHA